MATHNRIFNSAIGIGVIAFIASIWWLVFPAASLNDYVAGIAVAISGIAIAVFAERALKKQQVSLPQENND